MEDFGTLDQKSGRDSQKSLKAFLDRQWFWHNSKVDCEGPAQRVSQQLAFGLETSLMIFLAKNLPEAKFGRRDFKTA